MALLLYTFTAGALLWLAHRFVRPLSRWAATVLFLVPFVFFGYALITSRVVAPVDLPYQTVPLNWMKAQHGVEEISPGFHSDAYTQFMPWRRAVQWSLGRGEWGLRDPHALTGDILLAAQQSAVYWPVTLLALLLPAALSFTYTAAVVLLIAALCAFLLARELECDEAPSLIAAAAWALSTAVISFALVAMGATWAWCPLLLLGVRRAIVSPSVASGALLTVAFTALLYSAHPESVVLCVLLGMLYALFELARHRQNIVRAIVTAVAAAFAALLLSAIHLLPFLEALPQSAEYAHRQTLGATAPLRPAESLARVATSFVPYLHGRRWAAGFERFDTGVVGSVVLALAIFAVIRVRSATSWFFAALALFSLAGHAKWEPLVAAMQKVPLLNIALTDRLSFGVALSLSILAAMGAQHLTRRAALVMGLLVLVLAAANWWAIRTPLVDHGVRRHGEYAILAEIGILLIAAAVVAARRPLPAARVLLALVIIQRFVTEHGIYKSFDLAQAYPPIPIFEPLKSAPRPFRVVGHGNALIPQTATMYGLEDARGFSALTNARYVETFPLWCTPQPVFFNRVDDLTRPFLSFLNVRYAVTWDRDPPPPGWREVARQPGSILIENTRALDRAFVPPVVRFGPWTDMLGSTDFAQQAWIEANLQGERANGPGSVIIRDARLGYDIDAGMQGDGWIVTSITAWKGWRAYIDGRRVGTHIANHAFVSVFVPRGSHRVELRYWPESFVWGRAVTAATLLAAVMAMLWWRYIGPGVTQRRSHSSTSR